jgi:hypothetical protein
VSWAVPTSDGAVRFEHDYPDALCHHYTPTGMNEDVPLYEGEFHRGDRTFDGDVRYRWYPRPRTEVRGSRETSTEDLKAFLSTTRVPQFAGTRGRVEWRLRWSCVTNVEGVSM